MKTKITLCALFLCISLYTKAQGYVTIPDANFAAWLNTHYPACMNGNQMDTTCNDIIIEDSIAVSGPNIGDLTGIKYFTNLQFLDCAGNQLGGILSALPESLHYLNCSFNQLFNLPTLPGSLRHLICGHNQLINLPVLPDSLLELNCTVNQLGGLPALPNSLIDLECGVNQLMYLPILPNSLKYLYCATNPLTSLQVLPDSLHGLDCFACGLSCFPIFPNSIVADSFDIGMNPFNCLPNYINAMNSSTLSYPLCVQGDSINNPNNCIATNIKEPNTAPSQISIFPNPVLDNATLIFSSTKAQRLQIKVFDMIGQEILLLNKSADAGTNNIQINTQTLAVLCC